MDWLNLGDSYYNTGTHSKPGPGWKRGKQLTLTPFRVALAMQEDGWLLRNTVVWHKSNAMPSSVRDRLTNTWEPVFLFAKQDKYYFDLDAVRVPHKTDDEVERMHDEYARRRAWLVPAINGIDGFCCSNPDGAFYIFPEVKQFFGRGAIVDSQSLRAAETVGRAERGYDGAKKIDGTKRHIAVDTIGLLLAVVVTAASVQDRDCI